MSYSLNARGTSKAETKRQVAERLAAVLNGQPEHKADVPAVQAAVEAFIDGLADDDTKDIIVEVHGSVGWQGRTDVGDPILTDSRASIVVYSVTR